MEQIKIMMGAEYPFNIHLCFTCQPTVHNFTWQNQLPKLKTLFSISKIQLINLKHPSCCSSQNMAEGSPKSIYDFTVKDIQGNAVPLSNYRGKVLLIVNVASKCGLTDSNYKELNVLYEKYKDQGFEILAFPCNQFLWQEPGTNEEIQQTVCTRFKAEFPVFEKIDVNGDNAAPLYKFLKSEKGGFLGSAVKWNFTKFLVNKEGKVVERYAPKTPPLQFEKDIQNLLGSS
ncbi:putative glutathione peroxidase 2 [Capsicum chacoense]